jgi:isopenicillin-N epimerase
MKNLFLLDPAQVFLNHGSFGACPAEVFDHYHHWQREMERNPVDFLGRRSGTLLGEARAVLAQYLGAQTQDLVFMPNATTGVNTVARSLAVDTGLLPGDEILSTDHEYGACDATWDWVCQHTGARMVRAEIPLPFCATEFTERVWAGVTPRTRVLFLSHITSGTALIFPIAELVQRARAAGILTLIDGAHAPGHITLNLDTLGADFYTGNCHKWLCAPKGSAFLHVRREHHAVLHAPVISWGYAVDTSGTQGNAAYTGTTLLERHMQWQGTRDIAAFLAVPAAIAFQARHNWPLVRQRCHAMAADTLNRVCAHTDLAPVCSDGDFGQMVVLPVPAMDAALLAQRLQQEFGIEIPVTTHQGRLFVRISVQGYNTQSDVDALVLALQAIYPRQDGSAGNIDKI